ncbi:MAG TPA: S24 family peptidase, partial [Candidatus Paceibacterota bacterium]|nr:S24 family peptidase [Candidatus Paceibacterota bacterium]
EKKDNAKLGDIVVACVDGDWTLKYLRKDKAGRMYLEPANVNYHDIYPQAELTIGGVVRGVLRKY